jgi:hypothetical protein
MPLRQQDIVRKYTLDINAFLGSMREIIIPSGKLIIVIGNSNFRGCFIENSALYRLLAQRHDFELTHERDRALPPNRRYLPTTSVAGALTKRMNSEVVQAYSKVC